MKILLTTDCYAPTVNGVVTSVINLRAHLIALGHEVRVLTLAGTPRTTVAGGITAIGSIDVGRVYPGARLRSAAASSAVRALIAWRPDIVHSQCEFSTFFLAKKIARACDAPLIHTYHTVYEDYTHYFSPSRRWGRLMARGLTRLVLDGTDRVIAPTEKIAALLHRYRVRPPIAVIPTGIDLAGFAPQAVPGGDALRQALGIPAQNRIVLFVGRLAREKNIEELLACRAQLPAATTLLLVGGGPMRRPLEEQARTLGLAGDAVVFAGMVPPQEVARYYQLGDVFVSASSSETQGLTYIEALAAGLPAVCRADACLAGVIENGRNGWQYQTAGELAQRVTELLQNDSLRADFSRRAQQTAAGYSAAEFARRVLNCYRSALAQRDAAALPAGKEALWQKA